MFEVAYPRNTDYYGTRIVEQAKKQIFVLEKVGSKTIATEYEQTGDQVSSGKIINMKDFANSVNSACDATGNNTTKAAETLLDERILVQTSSTLVWKYTPTNDQLFFYEYGASGYVGQFNWPTLLFKMIGGQLSVAVLRSAHNRPNANTKLYHAPFPNINSSGKICLGNVVLPKNKNIDDISKAYLESKKTHFSREPYFAKNRKESTQGKFGAWLRTKAITPVKMSELTAMCTVQEFLKK